MQTQPRQPYSTKANFSDSFNASIYPIKCEFAEEAPDSVALFQQQVYSSSGYNVNILNDPFSRHAIQLYSEDKDKSILSTARIVFDSDMGYPAEPLCGNLVKNLRKRGGDYAELGRFTCHSGNRKDIIDIYRAVYLLATELKIESYFAVLMAKNLGFYRKTIGVDVVKENINYDYGTGKDYASIIWNISGTNSKFLKFVGR